MGSVLHFFFALSMFAGSPALVATPSAGADTEISPSPARQLWERGQQAMRLGQSDQAIAFYEQSLSLDPQLIRAHLSLAAARLEIGDDDGACPHLGRYVEARPDETIVRGHYAELLYRLRRTHDAREQFKRFVVDAQEQGGTAAKELLHAHARLVEIAEKEEDAYAEHLNRGIGLLLLSRARAELSDEDKDLTQESLLCKAAGELTLALEERPGEARPCWYISRVWSALSQRSLAARWLREAQASDPFSYLTPAERCSLQLAVSGTSHEFGRR